MSGPIIPISKSHTVDRRSTSLETTWLHDLQSPSWRSPDFALFVEEGQPFSADGDVVLVMVRPGAEVALQHAAERGRNGARIYVLAQQQWTPKGTPLQGIRRMLIRRVGEVPAAGLAVGASAAIWCGKAMTWRLALTPSQSAAFRQLFLRVFWHEAVDEGWLGDGQVEFRSAGARPFDVPEIAPVAAIFRIPASEPLRPARNDTHALLSAGPRGGESLRRIWTPPSGTQTSALRSLMGEGGSVTWDDCGLPDTSTDGRTGTLLLAGKETRLRVELSVEQSAAALQVLDGPAAWSLLTGLKIGAFADKPVQFWLPGTPGPAALTSDEHIEVPALRPTTLRDVHDATPGAWPAPSALTLSVTYRWQVEPPVVPKGAQDDPLVGRWRNVDRDWTKRLQVLREALTSASGLRATIGQSFKRLLNALMGYKRDESRLKMEVDALDRRQPSAEGPAGSTRLLDRLGRLEGEIGRLHDDLQQAHRKAREDAERERQQAEWAASVAAAKDDHVTKTAQLTAARDDQARFDAQVLDVEAELTDETDKKVKKDLKARHHKLSDQGKRAARTVQQLEQQIAALKRQIELPFKYKPLPSPAGRKAKTTGRFVPTALRKAIKTIPDDALPVVGALRKYKGKRYLVISDWSDLARGEDEAARLNARLVAEEKV